MKLKVTQLMWHRLSLLLITVFISFPLNNTEEIYYVTPTPGTPCPGEPCHTLSQYADHYFKNFSSNTTLLFLSGDHNLNRTISIETASRWSSTLIGQPTYYFPYPSLTLLGSPSSFPEVTSRIVCTQPAGFVFSGISELHISALAFISCGSDNSGAINIQFVSNTNISSCTFQNNTIKYLSGSCLYVYSNNTLTLSENIFQNNFGGALYAYTNNTLTLSKNKFLANLNAAYIGGALIADTGNTLNFLGNTFQNNYALNGGAVIVHTNNTLTLSGNTFQNNSAEFDGGALYITINNILSLSNNKFLTNSAEYGGICYAKRNNIFSLSGNTFQDSFADHTGGAYYVYANNTLTFSANTFQNNSAIESAGAFYANTLALSENTFLDNSADYEGLYVGCVLNVDTNNTITLSENTFQNNFGGALYAYTNNTLTLSKNKFLTNLNSGYYGGALMADTRNNLNFSENTFQNNYALYAGAVIVNTNNTLTLTRNIFQNNSANDTGGALFVNIGNILALSNNKFISNSAEYGGICYAKRNNIFTLFGNTFQGNFADYGGGALYAHTNNTLTLSNNKFQNNSADYFGGALYVHANNNLTLLENTFQNNSADDGGAVDADTNNTLTLSGNTFQENSADYGASLYVYANNTVIALPRNTSNTLIVPKNKFLANLAGYGGGIFANTSNIINVSACVFQKNSAAYGGAFSVYENNILTLSDNAFWENSAQSGGVLAVFVSNSLTVSENIFQNSYGQLFGGVFLILTNNVLNLSANTFQDNGNSVYLFGGVLYINERNILDLSNNTFLGNSAQSGGAVYADSNNNLNVLENTFQNNFAIYAGGALFVRQSTVYLTDNTFFGNIAQSVGGAIICVIQSTLIAYGGHSIQNNMAQYGGGIAILECHITAAGTLLFENNTADFGGGLYADRSNVSGYANFSNNVASIDGGGIYAVRSSFHFEQCTTFTGNSAQNGGGILFTENSNLNLQPNTTINFINNLAELRGGAVKVERNNPLGHCVNPYQSCGLLVDSDCFFQIQIHRQYYINDIDNLNISELHSISIYFDNNTASEAGADLYGGSIDNCSLNFISPFLDPKFHPVPHEGYINYSYGCPESGKIFDDIFYPSEQSLDISSDPLYICSCEDDEGDCSASSITRSVYPGGAINIPIIAYGQRNGTTPAVIHNIHGEEITIDEPEIIQSITSKCTLLKYTVQTRSVGSTQELTLYADNSCPPKERIVSSVPTNVVEVSVIILPCPPGFELLHTQPFCNCAQRLERFTTTCRIENRKIKRNSDFWVGYVPNSTSDGLILHPHCPFDYCTTKTMYIAVDDSDEQCSNNRTGLLCGKCGQSFSLALGTNRCLQCSNTYLWLIVAFAFAGVVLVLLLLALRLTVAVGTINGLVFYANIFAVNSAILFKAETPSVLTVFIAWLNLDLGTETCFYNGMDAYAKAWLQFVFPVYVWALVGIIILISHYSSKVATILGTNPIAVLATLFLLSYSKFLRAIIAALSYTLLEYPNNSQIAVWLYDGNISYLSNKHIPLFIAALVCLILLFLPYTLFLIFSQWLRSKSGQWRIFHWVNHYRVLPFLDAYHGPYTAKHRYWTGLMLLVRCILFLIFAINGLGDPNVNLLTIASVTTLLPIIYALFGNRIYDTWYLNVLELSFIANLGVLSLATLYIRSTGGNQNAVTSTSISIAFATFTGIVIFHSAQQIKDTPRLWRRMFPQYVNYQLVLQTNTNSGTTPPIARPLHPSGGGATVTHINVRELINQNELREPCIEMDY